MALHLIQSNVELSRTVTASFRLSRHEYGEPVADQWCDDGSGMVPLPDKHVGGVGCKGKIVISNMNGDTVLEAGLSGSTFSETGELPEDPECPGDYQEAGGPIVVSLHKTIYDKVMGDPTGRTGTLFVDSWTHNGWHAQVCHAVEYGLAMPGRVSVDDTTTIAATISGPFNLYASYDEELYDGQSLESWAKYIRDHDPYGMTSRNLEYWYEPAGEITITVSSPIGGTVYTISASSFDSQAEFVEFFRNGFKASVEGTAISRYDLHCLHALPEAEKVMWGSISGSGCGDGTVVPSASVGGYGGGAEELTFHPTDGSFEYWDDGDRTYGDDAPTPTVDLTCGPFTVSYSGVVQDIDGTSRTASILSGEYHDPASPICLSGPVISESIAYEGCWSVRCWGMPQYQIHKVDGVGLGGTSSSHYHEIIGLTNLASMGEPDFPADPSDADSWFRDSRVEIAGPHFSWPAALTIDVPESKDILTFNSASGWSVSDGEADISLSGGKLHIQVTSGTPTISHAISGVSLAGARFADLVYTATDTEPIEIGIDGSTYEVKPDEPTIDLIAPTNNALSVDSTQLWQESWGYGMHEISSISFSGLRAGRSYLFEKLTLKRHQSGSAWVYVTQGGFIGDQVLGMESADPYSGSVKFRVFVDGIVALEGYDRQALTTANLASLVSTTSGMVTCSVGAGGWSGAESTSLAPGYYPVEGTSVQIPARLTAARVTLPVPFGGAQFQANKHLRGRIFLRAPDRRGKKVVLEKLVGSTVVDTQELETDGIGLLVTPSLQQPVHNSDVRYRFLVPSGSSGGVPVASGGKLLACSSTGKLRLNCCQPLAGEVETRNRTISLLTIH